MFWRASPCSSALWLALTLTGCGPRDRPPDPFRETGELIALSGGDSGAKNACFTCHGRDGGGDGQAVPRLAGLPRGQLQKQLEDYASGRRPDPVMTRIAQQLTPEDRRKVAAYYAGLPPVVLRYAASTEGAFLYGHGSTAQGLAPCGRCHGLDGQGDAANPPLAGQPPAYLAEQLLRFRKGERRNDPQGVMVEISQRLTPAEIAAVSAFAAALSGSSPASSGQAP